MRKKPSIQVISEVALSLPEVAEKLKTMDKRIKLLETEIFWAGPPPQASPTAKRRKGRRPKLEQQELLARRTQLTTWLEQNWPYLSVALRKAKSAHAGAAAINEAKKRKGGIMQPPFYHEPEKHEATLWQFLQSGRFHGNPRNLAAAMAGLPELSWKRSFDVCSSHPCKQPLAIEAYWDYLRRNFPDRWRELRGATTPEQVKAVLRRSRTNDPHYLRLKKYPEEALESLNAGNPANARAESRSEIGRKPESQS